MPFDHRALAALARLSTPLTEHRSLLAATVDEARGWVTERADAAHPGSALDGAGAGLGAMGGTHIDAGRFAALVEPGPALDGAAAEAVARAIAILERALEESVQRRVLQVPPRERVSPAVQEALAEVGRGFGAARVVRLARSGGYRPAEHERWLSDLPFQTWTSAERNLAPPLVVEVDGSDLDAAGLSEVLDGGVKLVLVVTGVAPPAPLVRLITPGVFVAQSTDDTPLERLAESEGPGIVALMPGGGAQFVHDPRGGGDLADRLTIVELPKDPPRGRVGGRTARQQREELAQLEALRAVPRGAPAAAAAPGEPQNPADKLAAWLLGQANIEEPA